MALPTSRNRTYIDGATIIPASDLNEIQDYLIQAHKAAAASNEYFLGAEAGMPMMSGGAPQANFTISGGLPNYWGGVAASAYVEWPLPFAVGDVISECKAYINDTANAMFFRLYKINIASDTKTQVGGTITSAASSSAQTLTIATGLPYTVAAGEALFAEVQFGAANFAAQKIRGVSFKKQRP